MVPAQGLITAILSGPTATGKSAIALEFARGRLGTASEIEIINADSLLIYKHMNIGTAKPSASELAEIPHHLIDIRDPDQPFTAGDFEKLVHQTIAEVHSRGKRALIAGGTGFYLKALIYGLWEGAPADPAIRGELEKRSSPELYQELFDLDQEAALRIGVNDRYRLVRALELYRHTGKTPSELQAEQNREPNTSLKLFVIDRPNEELFVRIAQRTKAMLDAGFIDEVTRVRQLFPASRALGAVGYAQVCQYLDGATPGGRKLKPGLAGLQDEIELATRQLVKRQRTWFNSEKSAHRFELERDHASLMAELERVY
jgi:tRNA dimethylallyltransferase